MCGLLLKGLPFALLCPALVLFGGSTSLINWGPGLLIAGLACLMLLDKDRHALRDGKLHRCCFLGLLGLMWIRAGDSEDACATANNTTLLSLAAAGYLIGRMAGVAKSRALLTGLSLVLVLNFSCTLLQLGDRE